MSVKGTWIFPVYYYFTQCCVIVRNGKDALIFFLFRGLECARIELFLSQ